MLAALGVCDEASTRLSLFPQGRASRELGWPLGQGHCWCSLAGLRALGGLCRPQTQQGAHCPVVPGGPLPWEQRGDGAVS